jgi:hypothetical protein
MTFDDVRQLALAWPEVDDGTASATRHLRCARKCWSA